MAAVKDSQPREVTLSWVSQHPNCNLSGQSFLVAVSGSTLHHVVKQCILTPTLERPCHEAQGLFLAEGTSQQELLYISPHFHPGSFVN